MSKIAKVTSDQAPKEAKNLLSAKSDTWDNKNSYKADISVKFDKPTNVDAFGIKAGSGPSNENPHYVHLQIWTGKHKQDVIRKTSWKSKKAQEIRLWTGHLSGVTKVEFFLRNAKKTEKRMQVDELTFYQQK
jgi:hypothetical protein